MGNPHSLRLIDVHHPRRSHTEERLQQTRISLVTIIEKDKILNNNIHDNLQEIGEETQFYAWAGLDLTNETVGSSAWINLFLSCTRMIE